MELCAHYLRSEVEITIKLLVQHKLSCRKEAARCSDVSLTHSSLFKFTPLSSKFLLVFDCDHVTILCRFWYTKRRIMVCLEIWVMAHPSSLKMAPFDWPHTSSYSSSIVTVAISGIVSEIKRDIGRKSRLFHTTLLRNNLAEKQLRIFSRRFYHRFKSLP